MVEQTYSLVIIYRNGQTYHLTGQSKKIVSTCGQVEIKENKGCIVFNKDSFTRSIFIIYVNANLLKYFYGTYLI